MLVGLRDTYSQIKQGILWYEYKKLVFEQANGGQTDGEIKEEQTDVEVLHAKLDDNCGGCISFYLGFVLYKRIQFFEYKR